MAEEVEIISAEDVKPGEIAKKMTFGGEEFEVLFAKGNPGKTREELEEIKRKAAESGGASDAEMVATMGYCAPYNPHTYLTELQDVICERDQACTLRDGTVIYADIYRPITTEKIPVICVFAPFGKNPSEGMDSWQLMGVPPKTVSQYAKFEAPDPGYWCRQGYAVANVDPRGVGNSQGDVYLWGSQDAEDGYDFIEWVTAQDWCNGKATMIGNSGVCMAHWRIAATRPPHLACIAAWEGQGDLYRESYFCGGIPNPDYETHIIDALAVNNYIEDTPEMMKKYPLMNSYYKDKIVDWNKIRIPAYVTAGWVHHHLRGAFEGFRRIRSPKKWMRAHRDFEWPDSYKPENLEDVKRFFDRYCKGIHNGWEMTPRVRIDVMDRDHHVHLSVHRGHRDHRLHEAAPQRRVPRLRQHGPVPVGHQAGQGRQLRADPRDGRSLSRRMGLPALQPSRSRSQVRQRLPARAFAREGRAHAARRDRPGRRRVLSAFALLAQGRAAAGRHRRPLHQDRVVP